MNDTHCYTMAELSAERGTSGPYRLFLEDPLKTGFKTLDDVVGGFPSGELICIGGRHAIGSTGLALSILSRVCVKDKKTCLYFALADGTRSTLHRLLANVSENTDIHYPDQEELCLKTLAEIGKAPLYINETAFSISSIEKACKELHEKAPLDLVIIDYHQIIRERTDDRIHVSVCLKRLARILGCPIIVLCQLERSIDDRKDPRPVLSDLNGIGRMNLFADTVLLLYRSDYYSLRSDRRGSAKVFVAKNSHARPLEEVTLSHKGAGVFTDRRDP